VKIKEIEVQYSITQSLREYNNVRPGVRLLAALEEGDDPEQVCAELLQQARATVQAEVDDALEANGQAPRFYEGPLYEILWNRRAKVIAVFPHDLDRADLPGGHYAWERPWGSEDMGNLRLPMALSTMRRRANQSSADYLCVDCSDGDLSRLPAMEQPGASEEVEEEEGPPF
jgi:hypothetical protein